MCLLGEYFAKQFESCIDLSELHEDDLAIEFDVREDGEVQRKVLLTGLIVLDAIFYPLQKYLNIIINTETDNNYSTDIPFEYLTKCAKILDIESPFETILHNKENWNPSNNEYDFVDLIRPNPEVYGKQARSQLKAQIARNERLHKFLVGISAILDFVEPYESDEEKMLIKKCFLFFILDNVFQIVNNHFPGTTIIHNNHMSFTKMYLGILEFNSYQYFESRDNEKKDEDGKRNRKTSTLSIRSISPFLKKKWAVGDFVEKYFDEGIKIVANYIGLNIRGNIYSFDPAFFKSIADIRYVKELLKNGFLKDYIGYFSKVYREDFIIGEKKKYDGNIDYIEDVFGTHIPYKGEYFNENRGLDELENISNEYEDNLCEGSSYLARRKRIIGVEKITNPFSKAPFLTSRCENCPFRLYQYSMQKLSSEICKIHADLKSNVECLRDDIEQFSKMEWYQDASAKVEEIVDLFNSMVNGEDRECQVISAIQIQKGKDSKKSSKEKEAKDKSKKNPKKMKARTKI